MNLLQPWRDIPEFSNMPPSVQKRCWKSFEAYWVHKELHSPVSRDTILGVIIGVPWIMALTHVASEFGFGDRISQAVVIVVGLVPLGVWRTASINRALRHAIREYLHQEYVGELLPVCTQCGYALFACSPDLTACPECGNPEVRGDPPVDVPPEPVHSEESV